MSDTSRVLETFKSDSWLKKPPPLSPGKVRRARRPTSTSRLYGSALALLTPRWVLPKRLGSVGARESESIVAEGDRAVGSRLDELGRLWAAAVTSHSGGSGATNWWCVPPQGPILAWRPQALRDIFGWFFMQPRITVLTLGVDDLDASLRFYRDGLGFATEGIIGKEFEYGAVVFIDLQSGLRLALWPRTSIAHDTGLQLAPASPTELTLGHNVASKEEVDSVIALAEEAGATIVKAPHDTFWGGYSGYFQDPDGHLWEVVYNPALSP